MLELQLKQLGTLGTIVANKIINNLWRHIYAKNGKLKSFYAIFISIGKYYA